MFKRLYFVAVTCLLLSTTVLAQVGVDFRDAVKTAGPATIAVMLGGEERDLPIEYRLDRDAAIHAFHLYAPWGASQLQSEVKPMRSGFAVAPDLVISCELPTTKNEVKVATRDGGELKGQVVVRDHVTGLVAIRIEDASLSGLALAPEAAPAGLPVLVNWLRNGKTVTSDAAMIATEACSDQALIGFTQTIDADFTPPKLGAPVVDSNGSLVGVLLHREGVTICLPAVHVARLIEAASAEEPKDLVRGRLGIRLDESQGPTIVEVMDDTVAQEAELKAGDRISKIGGRECKTHADVMAAVAMSRGGDDVTLEIQRGDETIERTFKLASVADEPRATSFHHGRFTPWGGQQFYQFKDGKLVPMNEDGSVGESEFQRTPGFLFGNLQVERSKLEDSLKKLEAEKRQQDETIKQLREEISRTETESAASINKKLQEELSRFEKILEEIKERTNSEGSVD